MNSRDKGKRGEREFASLLREHGFDARRGQQFSGGADSPDVVSKALSWIHFEIKRVQNLNLTDACVQAEGDCKGKWWAVAHRRNRAPWLITIRAEFFFALIRAFLPKSGKREIGKAEMMEWGIGSADCGMEDTNAARIETGNAGVAESTPHPTLSPFEAERDCALSEHYQI